MSYSKFFNKIQSVAQNLVEVRKKRDKAYKDKYLLRISLPEHQQILELENLTDKIVDESQAFKDYQKYSEEYYDLDKTLNKLISDLWRFAKDGTDPDFEEVK